MIKCTKCSASLPDWAKSCQFCGTDVSGVARPAPVQKQSRGRQPEQWVMGAYYGLAGFYMIDGLYHVVMALANFKHAGEDVSVIIGLIIGALTFVVGLGLVLRIEFIRGVVNFFCGLQILFGILNLGGLLMGAFLLGPLMLVFLAVTILEIGAAAFMIYLIGETDRVAPNL